MTSWLSRPGSHTTPSCPASFISSTHSTNASLMKAARCGASASHLPSSLPTLPHRKWGRRPLSRRGARGPGRSEDPALGASSAPAQVTSCWNPARPGAPLTRHLSEYTRALSAPLGQEGEGRGEKAVAPLDSMAGLLLPLPPPSLSPLLSLWG